MAESQEHEGNASGNIFERQLSDNCVEYKLFYLDSQSDARKQLYELEVIRKDAIHRCQTLAKDYIWQRDEFNLELKTEKDLIYLAGLTDYGDAVEDEWLIVYFLRELTRSHPKLWVRINDTDGEFLLIEAANVLPKWLNPENDQERAWVHDGKLLVLPNGLKDDLGTSPRNLSLREAVTLVESKPKTMVHSSFIESEAFYRLGKYPGQITDSLHHSLVTLPRRLASIIHSLPQSVAPAVEAFYLRDAFSLKPIFEPSPDLKFPPVDFVTVSVRFSKVLFAQLRSQRFETPPVWEQAISKANSDSSSTKEAETTVARLEMGMKLACGYETLAQKAETSKNRVAREFALILDDVLEDGDNALPSDTEINSWPDVKRHDDEGWMDINYEDFERELEGKRAATSGSSKTGFGDAQTQADLKKIVSRFEQFLNDESAGLEGAEMDDMDFDDDEDDSEEDSDAEDKEVSFDEEEFSRMMSEMMGLPPKKTKDSNVNGKSGAAQSSTIDADDDKDIQDLAAQMEAELKGHGALTIDEPSKTQGKLKGKQSAKTEGAAPEPSSSTGKPDDEDDEDSQQEPVDIDYNLAKNLLESFKSQGGMAGPTGNLLGMMGFQLPRDEDDGDDLEDNHDKHGSSR